MVPERFVEVEERLYHLVKHCKYFLGHDASMHMCPKDFTIDCIINTVLEPASSLCAKWRLGGLMARVSERNSKARETGGLSIARRWSAPCVSMVRVTPRKE